MRLHLCSSAQVNTYAEAHLRMNAKEDLKKRFSDLRLADVKAKRGDFKGARKKMTLRVPPELLDQLRLLKLAGNVEANAFCVATGEMAVEARLAQIKATFDTDSWNVLIRCCDAGKGSVQVD